MHWLKSPVRNIKTPFFTCRNLDGLVVFLLEQKLSVSKSDMLRKAVLTVTCGKRQI